MLPTPTIRDWARHLLDYERLSSAPPLQTDLATLIVYQKLRQQLCAPVGIDGFQALATRALRLAREEAPDLNAVQLTSDGSLSGLTELEKQTDSTQESHPGVVLISHLLGLFLTFLGTETTQRFVKDVFPDAATPLQPSAAKPLEGASQEVSELRHVSERLQSLADKYPSAGDGLTTIAGSVRNLASILDVFLVMKDMQTSVNEGELPPNESRYLM
jgi:hypothetical protein